MKLNVTLEWSKDPPTGGKRQYLNAVAQVEVGKETKAQVIGPVAWIEERDALIGKRHYQCAVLGPGWIDGHFMELDKAKSAVEEHVILTYKGV